MKKGLLFASMLTALIGFSSCSKSSSGYSAKKIKQEVTFNIQGDPFCLDPRKARRLNDLNLLKTFNEGLFRTDKNGDVKEAIASKMTLLDDKKTYIIELKETLWSNGDPVTAQDFIYSWKSSLDKDFPSPYASALYPLKNAKAIKEGLLPTSMLGLTAEGDFTLIVELEDQTPFFTELLTLPVFFPVNKSIVEGNPNWHLQPDEFVCNGPFKLDKWIHKDEIIAIRNTRYWDRESVKLQRLNMIMVDPDTAFRMYENGELNWAGSPYSNIPPDAVHHLKDNDMLMKTPVLNTYMLKTNIDAYPLNNKNLRKSIAHAINRADIVEHVLFQGANPATTIVPPCLNLEDAGYITDGNKEKAIEFFNIALEELSVTKKNFPPVTITYNASEKSHKIVSAIQDQIKSVLGINVNLEPLESKVCLDKLARSNYQLVFRDWTADFKDPVNFLEVFKTKQVGTNNTNWESLDYLSAIEASYHADTAETRLTHLKKAEEILMDDMPAIPLYHLKMMHLQDENLKDVILSETGSIDFKCAYFSD